MSEVEKAAAGSQDVLKNCPDVIRRQTGHWAAWGISREVRWTSLREEEGEHVPRLLAVSSSLLSKPPPSNVGPRGRR